MKEMCIRDRNLYICLCCHNTLLRISKAWRIFVLIFVKIWSGLCSFEVVGYICNGKGQFNRFPDNLLLVCEEAVYCLLFIIIIFIYKYSWCWDHFMELFWICYPSIIQCSTKFKLMSKCFINLFQSICIQDCNQL